MTQEIQQRPPHWDVSKVYPGLLSPEFQADIDWFAVQLQTFEDYLNENHIEQVLEGIKGMDSQRFKRYLGFLDLAAQ